MKQCPSDQRPGLKLRTWAALLFLALFLNGCTTCQHSTLAGSRHFDFDRDTMAFANELIWEYYFDDQGKWVSHAREPKPDYSLHCFVVARSVRQFFQNARFDAALPKATEAEYRTLVRRVVSSSPRKPLPPDKQIIIPGYADLREFSAAHERALKDECGSAWESYFQRGHWRMVFPFSTGHQEKTAEHLLRDVQANQVPVVHIVRFPSLSINHALVVFDALPTEESIQFTIYDPNDVKAPGSLAYDRKTRHFSLPQNKYFPGGRVDAYEVYTSWDY